MLKTQTRDTNVCTIKEMMELCVQREVIGVRGEDAILPCLFHHNEGNNTSELVFILYKGNDFIYDSMSRSKGRIQTVGNPSEGDGTVRIIDLKMEDEGTYGCGFRFKKLGDQEFTTIFMNKERRSELRVHGMFLIFFFLFSFIRQTLTENENCVK
uniref:Immunoglobulin domain-containing protein n=1 Tax=Eptatretus burgeri TaxID=7764 RepID=A0A8C4RAG0_EPTBU